MLKIKGRFRTFWLRYRISLYIIFLLRKITNIRENGL